MDGTRTDSPRNPTAIALMADPISPILLPFTVHEHFELPRRRGGRASEASEHEPCALTAMSQSMSFKILWSKATGSR